MIRWDAYLVNGVGRLRVPVQRQVAGLYAWACERLYHQMAGQYDKVAWLVSAGRWRHWTRMAWDEVRGPHVLELGSGPGHLLVEGRAKGLDVVGLELSPAMIALAQRRRSAGAVCVRGDGRTLPFADAVFDTVLATFPAAYALEDVTLRECRRVLRSAGGGRLALVGLWVAVDLAGVERLAPVFYAMPSEERLQRMAERVAQAGFVVQLRTWRDGRVAVGGLVAETR